MFTGGMKLRRVDGTGQGAAERGTPNLFVLWQLSDYQICGYAWANSWYRVFDIDPDSPPGAARSRNG
jgi:hypothetical protein